MPLRSTSLLSSPSISLLPSPLSLPGFLSVSIIIWLNFPEYLPSKYFPTHTNTCEHTDTHLHAHTDQALCEVIEAFIQMVMSWGTGLPEELLFLVRRRLCSAWTFSLLYSSHHTATSFFSLLLLFLSLFTLHLPSHSASSAPLNQHPHFSCCRNPLLLLLHLHISSYPPSLCVSPSKDSVNQAESTVETFTPAGR